MRVLPLRKVTVVDLNISFTWSVCLVVWGHFLHASSVIASAILQGVLMNAENDPILAAVLRYTAPVALVSMVLTTGFVGWILSA